MAASILSRTISAVVDKRLVLSNDQCARTMSIGTTWSQIRIGMRCSINPNGLTSSLPALVQMLFGLSSGSTNTVGSATTTNFLGVHLQGGPLTPATMTYNAVTSPYYSPSTFGYICKKVATTYTLGSALNLGGGGAKPNMTADPAAKRNVWIVEITRGSPNYTVGMIAPIAAAGTAYDVSLAGFLASFESNTLGGVASALNALVGSSGYDSASAAFAFDIVAGDLDTINMSWGDAARTLEISDMIYARIL